ncbi:MAG: autotransporter-associated beta strand repeat-containing protein, partial [Crocinitomicaceae bacterium]|nr:autotransporter-associated beta strand repeat-containing protein [Crocinitomicaceae bacterium]
MPFKILKISKFLFSLVLICNLTKAQNVSESINVGKTNISSNFSIQGVNPVIISLKANAELPVTLIENYLNQDKDVRVESEGDILFSGLIHKTTQKSATLSLISKNAGLISFVDGSKMYSSKGKININITTEGSIVFSSKSFLQTNGGNIRLKAYKVSQNVPATTNSISIQGTLDASSHTKGGIIVIESDHIKLEAQAKILAKGELGGGAILIGGDWQGGANAERRVFPDPMPLYQATTVNMAHGASIDASATQQGNGGTVVLWSDVSRSNTVTIAKGSIYAKGGLNGGDGGQIETSGGQLITDGVTGSAAAPKGKAGDWLFDPYNIEIVSANGDTNGSFSSGAWTATGDSSKILNTSINSLLNAGTNVTVSTEGSGTQEGNITISADIDSTGSGNLALNAHGSISLAAGITVSTAGDVTLNAATFTGSGNIALANGRALSVTQSGTSTYSGIVSGTNSTLTKLGSGTLTLSGASSYTGLTTISAGALRLGAAGDGTNSPLGTIAAGTVVESGATLDLYGFSLSTAEPLTITGAGSGSGAVGQLGALVNYTTTNVTYSGLLSLGGNATILPYTGSINLSNTGTITGSGHTLTLNGQSNNNQLAGILAFGSGGLTMPSSGYSYSWILSGANTYTGPTTINGGTLKTTHSSALGNGSAVTIQLNSNGVLDISGSDLTVGSLASSYSGTGTKLNLGSNTLTIGTNNTSTTFRGVISGTGAVTKVGTGTLTLTGIPSTPTVILANDYSGVTTVSAGTLAVGNATLGSTAAGTTVASGATLDLRGPVVGDEAVTINGGTLADNSPNTSSSFSGSVVLGADSIVNVEYGAQLTLSGVISGGFGIAKTGTGTLVVSGNNTYTGTTTVSAGTLRVGAGSTTGALGSGNITNNAALIFNRSNDLTIANAISGSGSLTKLGSGTLTLTTNNTYAGTTTISEGNLVLQHNAPNPTSKTFAGTGALVIESVGTGFTSDFSTSGWNFGTTLNALTIGKSTNTSNVTIGSATTIAGPITAYGGNIAINSPLTATNNRINLNASSSVTQSAALTANNLSLNGTGSFILNNTFNNITTLAGGSNSSKLGSLSFTDASGGLNIGTVGANSGLTATGTILVESLIGDVTLAQNITTDNTTSNAVVVNAGKSSAIGTITGGNILISGTPTITMGSGGIAKLYSGSEAASTGLTTLVGGLGNTRFSADEGTTTFSPVLAAGNSYAIYRSTVPASPTNLVATAGNAQISVAFTAGADGGSAITNYEYTINGGTTWAALNPAVTSSPVTIPGLTNGTAYTVSLRAVNSVGTSVASASVTATPLPGGPACTTYTNKTPTSGLGNNQVRGVFAIGNTVYAATASGLSISTDGGATFTNRTTSNGLGNDLVNGVYAVGSTVYAATAGGLSISTDGGATFTNRTTSNGLGHNNVNGVYVAGSTVYAATLLGLGISTDGGTAFVNRPIASYVLGVYALGSTVYAATTAGLMVSINGGTTFTNRTTTNGLGNNRVNGVFAIGNTVYAATDGGLSISTDGGTSFTNRTTANGLGNDYLNAVYAIGSTVYVATTDGYGGVGGLSISTNGGVSFTNLRTTNGLGSNYIYGVFATANTVYAATGGGVSYCFAPTVPSAPTSLIATPGDGQIGISFTAGNNGGSAITNYEYTINGGTTWTALNPADGSSPVTIASLTNGTQYSIKIRAVNSLGFGAASSAVTATPLPALPIIGFASTTQTAVINRAISITTNNSGGAATFAIAPALPAGVALNSSTGLISGTPTAIMASRSYTVTATNAAGSSSATFSLFIDSDLDGDGIGDATDPDIDGDGVPNSVELQEGTS